MYVHARTRSLAVRANYGRSMCARPAYEVQNVLQRNAFAHVRVHARTRRDRPLKLYIYRAFTLDSYTATMRIGINLNLHI